MRRTNAYFSSFIFLPTVYRVSSFGMKIVHRKKKKQQQQQQQTENDKQFSEYLVVL